MILWPYDGELPQRTTRLTYSLFENLGPALYRQPVSTKDLNSAALDRLLIASQHAFVAIKHEVDAKRWDSITPELLKRYAEFWAGWARSDARPAIVIFISVVFPTLGDGWFSSLRGSFRDRARRQRIQSALEMLERSAGIPCSVLAELPPVTRGDVREWFRLNNIYESEADIIRELDRLFPKNGDAAIPMKDVEEFCKRVLSQIQAEGQDERIQ